MLNQLILLKNGQSMNGTDADTKILSQSILRFIQDYSESKVQLPITKISQIQNQRINDECSQLMIEKIKRHDPQS